MKQAFTISGTVAEILHPINKVARDGSQWCAHKFTLKQDKEDKGHPTEFQCKGKYADLINQVKVGEAVVLEFSIYSIKSIKGIIYNYLSVKKITKLNR